MINSIELFCGTGGLALGLQKAGLNHMALFELDKYSCDNIELNIKNGLKTVANWKVLNTDVRDINYQVYKGKVDVVSGGPPCQPFSLGGKAQAFNDKRDMWPEAIRAVKTIQPKAFIFENVKGLLRETFRDYFQYILLQLRFPFTQRKDNEEWEAHYKRLKRIEMICPESATYEITYQLVNVADYGVPQSRFRVFIIGFLKELNVDYSFPKPEYSKDALLYDKWVTGAYWKEHKLPKPICTISAQKIEQLKKNPPHKKRWRTVRDAIGDLPNPMEKNNKGIYNHEYRPGAKAYYGHTGSDLDEPSKTIKAGVHGVPGGENTFIQDDGTMRYYTVRESARIQTFDDEYEFGCPWGEAMRQIGNAVPVRMAEIVGHSVIEHLEEEGKNAK